MRVHLGVGLDVAMQQLRGGFWDAGLGSTRGWAQDFSWLFNKGVIIRIAGVLSFCSQTIGRLGIPVPWMSCRVALV